MVDGSRDAVKDYEKRRPKPGDIIQLIPYNKLFHGRPMTVTPAETEETMDWPVEFLCTSTGTAMATIALSCTYNTEARYSWS